MGRRDLPRQAHAAQTLHTPKKRPFFRTGICWLLGDNLWVFWIFCLIRVFLYVCILRPHCIYCESPFVWMRFWDILYQFTRKIYSKNVFLTVWLRMNACFFLRVGYAEVSHRGTTWPPKKSPGHQGSGELPWLVTLCTCYLTAAGRINWMLMWLHCEGTPEICTLFLHEPID